MNILYIGQYTPGTTSKMRADQLKQILESGVNPSPLGERGVNFQVIDTHIPFHQTPRLWRSLGFRYKRGPLIRRVNNYIRNQVNQFLNTSTSEHLNIQTSKHPNIPASKHPKAEGVLTSNHYDLIWIDKAIFLTPKTTRYLQSLTDKLVHFTPDMAFYANQSQHFEKSIKNYDYLITTKTAEQEEYHKRINESKLVFTTQGFDKAIHKPSVDFESKTNNVAFIGLCEPSREEIVEDLLQTKISVKIAGKGWQNFVQKHNNNKLLSFHGEGLFSNDYTRFLSSSLFSIGLLSKKFPERHTTRTFEIPASGTALITERNTETTSFFNEYEAIFYDSVEEMIEKIQYYQSHLNELEQLTRKGTQRVHQDGRDYESILRKILEKIGIDKRSRD